MREMARRSLKMGYLLESLRVGRDSRTEGAKRGLLWVFWLVGGFEEFVAGYLLADNEAAYCF
jgi:hypothetical protein